jgi:hypothetical protein
MRVRIRCLCALLITAFAIPLLAMVLGACQKEEKKQRPPAPASPIGRLLELFPDEAELVFAAPSPAALYEAVASLYPPAAEQAVPGTGGTYSDLIALYEIDERAPAACYVDVGPGGQDGDSVSFAVVFACRNRVALLDLDVLRFVPGASGKVVENGTVIVENPEGKLSYLMTPDYVAVANSVSLLKGIARRRHRPLPIPYSKLCQPAADPDQAAVLIRASLLKDWRRQIRGKMHPVMAAALDLVLDPGPASGAVAMATLSAKNGRIHGRIGRPCPAQGVSNVVRDGKPRALLGPQVLPDDAVVTVSYALTGSRLTLFTEFLAEITGPMNDPDMAFALARSKDLLGQEIAFALTGSPQEGLGFIALAAVKDEEAALDLLGAMLPPSHDPPAICEGVPVYTRKVVEPVHYAASSGCLFVSTDRGALEQALTDAGSRIIRGEANRTVAEFDMEQLREAAGMLMAMGEEDPIAAILQIPWLASLKRVRVTEKVDGGWNWVAIEATTRQPEQTLALSTRP